MSYLQVIKGLESRTIFLRTTKKIFLSSDSTKGRMFKWCVVGEVDSRSEVPVKISTDLLSEDGSVTDLSVASNWMEYIETSEGLTSEVGGAGAYDTLRCDLIIHPEVSMKPKWFIWGAEFHLERLCRSYTSLLKEKGTRAPESDKQIQRALADSRKLFEDILDAATQDKAMIQSSTISKDSKEPVVNLFRFTWLWTPPAERESIKVRAHACANYSFVSVAELRLGPKPIAVTIATNNTNPSRAHNPDNKVASWTRQRRQFELPETYKPDGVSEVLLVRPLGKSVELLEGLSSNVFVLYEDGTLRTASEGILHGYVRRLVLESAGNIGLKCDPRPILIQEAQQWKEAFITSSSRLIYPISKILIEKKNDENQKGIHFEELWADPILSTNEATTRTAEANQTTPIWKVLLDQILKQAGY